MQIFHYIWNSPTCPKDEDYFRKDCQHGTRVLVFKLLHSLYVTAAESLFQYQAIYLIFLQIKLHQLQKQTKKTKPKKKTPTKKTQNKTPNKKPPNKYKPSPLTTKNPTQMTRIALYGDTWQDLTTVLIRVSTEIKQKRFQLPLAAITEWHQSITQSVFGSQLQEGQ